MQSAECRVQSAKCRVQSAECKVQSAECKGNMREIDDFIEKLAAYGAPLVCNPWRDEDPALDIDGAAEIRRENLARYLSRRIGRARVLFIAEACGYQGGRFTGIAMTCERMLLSRHPAVSADMVLGREGRRTSREDSPLLANDKQRKEGFNEPTDTVVWKSAAKAGLAPEDFLLWNIFPFHPHKENAPLTNRTPTEKELAGGLAFTKQLLEIARPTLLLAIGRKSEETLQAADIPAIPLRHPANGGANLFRKGLFEALTK